MEFMLTGVVDPELITSPFELISTVVGMELPFSRTSGLVSSPRGIRYDSKISCTQIPKSRTLQSVSSHQHNPMLGSIFNCKSIICAARYIAALAIVSDF